MKVSPVIGSVIKRRPGGVIPAWAVALALRIRKAKESKR